MVSGFSLTQSEQLLLDHLCRPMTFYVAENDAEVDEWKNETVFVDFGRNVSVGEENLLRYTFLVYSGEFRNAGSL
jgi:hypothetical protein